MNATNIKTHFRIAGKRVLVMIRKPRGMKINNATSLSATNVKTHFRITRKIMLVTIRKPRREKKTIITQIRTPRMTKMYFRTARK